MTQTRFATLFVAFALAVAPVLADAKRLGSGRSSGLQRDMPARTAPDATPPKPAQAPQAQPGPAQQAAPATANAATAAAAPAKRSWLGPIAGIAAGLGLAALMSHLGLSEAFGSILLMILLAVAAFFVLRMVMRRFAPQPAAAQTMSRSPVQVAWPQQQQQPQPAAEPAAPVVAAPAAPVAAFVPAAFDSDGFARIAKTIFVRLQAANDAGDLEDLRRFTTPEMFAELKADLLDRASGAQTTDVVEVASTVLDVADDSARQIVSVRFAGRVREAAGAEPVAFDEVWHLVKPHGDGEAWRIAGIEQMAASA